MPNPLLYLQAHHVVWFIVLVLAVVLFHKRRAIKQKYIEWKERRDGNFLPLYSDDAEASSTSWINDIRHGLSSNNFNLFSHNLSKNDQRKGLDENAKAEVLKLMKSHNITFDEARLMYTRGKMDDNDIGEDGIPRDPKFVRF